LKRVTNEITWNVILDGIDLQKVEEFEKTANNDENYKRKLKTIYTSLKNADYLHCSGYGSAYDAYNELVIFEFLSTKVKVDFVKEETYPTPDYKLSASESVFLYADLKTLHFLDGNLNYIDVQNQSTNAKIKLEKEVKERRDGVFFGDPVCVSPFSESSSPDNDDIKGTIESIIDKLTSLLKLAQVNYDGRNGIYIIDTTHIGLPCDLKLGLPVHEGFQNKELISGILWNAVFGAIGDPTYNYVDFEGKPNIGKRLTKNGILNDDSFRNLKAVVFIMDSFSQNEKKVIGFYRHIDRDDLSLVEILYKISDFVNDEGNSNYWKLKD
jgi:hypothetical protein